MTAYFIVIGGFAGAVKSTLARRLGRTFSLLFYEIDRDAPYSLRLTTPAKESRIVCGHLCTRFLQLIEAGVP